VTVIFAMSALMIPFVYINISEGLGAVDEELLEMGWSFTHRPFAVFLRIVLPSLYPFALAALRISVGVAWKSTLLAELFGANEGLGFMVNQAREAYDSRTILAVIAIVVLIVFLTDRAIFVPLQRRLARHHAA
jgi:NitT/TauT family transport system permease protein/sulfonate transport system permease protein